VVSPVARASRLIASMAAIATAGSLCALDGDAALWAPGWGAGVVDGLDGTSFLLLPVVVGLSAFI
jgi:hypothetical protein